MNCKLKLHSKGFYCQILGVVTVLNFLQTLASDFPHICLQFFPGKRLQANVYKILKSGSKAYSCMQRPQFFSGESLGVKIYFAIHIFFRTAVLRKFLDIRFSYKHCNFSRGCLLVKTVIRPIERDHMFCITN